MTDKPSITAVYEQLGGRMARWSGWGWNACHCVLPAHDDRTASAQINEETGRWRCLACSVNYDVYGLVMAVQDICFRDARTRAAELAGGKTTTVPGGAPPTTIRRNMKGGYVPPWKRK